MKHPLVAHTTQLVKPTQYPHNLVGYKFIVDRVTNDVILNTWTGNKA